MVDQIWKTQNAYFATTNPGIYTGDRDNELLFYGFRIEEEVIGIRPLDDFDSIRYLFGTYYLHYSYAQYMDGGGETLFPFPYELLDKQASISFKDLCDYCRKLYPTIISSPPNAEKRRAMEYSQKHGWAKEDIRFWQPEDRIQLRRPLVYTKYIVEYSGIDGPLHFFDDRESLKSGHQGHYFVHDKNLHVQTEMEKGIIPEILYSGRFEKWEFKY